MSESSTLLVGSDIHKERIDVAPAFEGREGERRHVGTSRVTWPSTASRVFGLGSICSGNPIIPISLGLSYKRLKSWLGFAARDPALIR